MFSTGVMDYVGSSIFLLDFTGLSIEPEDREWQLANLATSIGPRCGSHLQDIRKISRNRTACSVFKENMRGTWENIGGKINRMRKQKEEEGAGK